MYKVAIFDDEYIVLQGLQHLIDWNGFGLELVGTASDGLSALDMVRKQTPDIVFTDIRMPGMDGLKLIEEIMAKAPDTYCIVFSGFNEFEYVKRALKLGVIDYLEKPVTLESIQSSIQRVLSRIEADLEMEKLRRQVEESKNVPKTGAGAETGDNVKLGAIERAKVYIEQNVSRDLSLNEVAEYVGMNAAYLSAVFKEAMGESYIKFLTRLRMELAKELLLKGYKVHEVSERVGYHTYRHFSEIFKKHIGVTPGQFKEEQEARNNH
ncbi:response regulator [Paenibacillus macerans]|uniref:response regulator transcription factor n=1 Tax=Paenibacillus macerans TaxID=44252 RepID=UPI00204269D4|nr:response regulator [Paenibacillus macerans]MCM3699441.1 response regulator [Paenibacillus macerans]